LQEFRQEKEKEMEQWLWKDTSVRNIEAMIQKILCRVDEIQESELQIRTQIMKNPMNEVG
jgi:hypothetical protein